MKFTSRLGLIAICTLLLTACSNSDGYSSTAPVITLNGSNPMDVVIGGTYNEPGSTAIDAEDGSVPVTTSGNVDTTTLGVYIITYSATDSEGLTATETRDVNVLTLEECEIAVFKNAQENSDLKIEWGKPIYTGLGTYARIKEVTNAAQNKQLLMVFSDGPDIRYRTSDDKGLTWSVDVIVACPVGNTTPGYDPTNPNAQYNYTNAEFVELSNGDWIISYNARPKGNEVGHDQTPAQPGVNFDIRTMTSHDKGLNWEAEKIIIAGGDKLERGIWEPIILELPSGELQMYYADEGIYYATKRGDQQISMLISQDSGATWGPRNYGSNLAPINVSYREGFRDGMPVPIISNDNELIMAIEDNGQDGPGGRFKPAFVRTTVVDSWSEGFVSGDSQNRNRALAVENQIPKMDTSGGSYVDQFPSGKMVMSAYSSQCRNAIGSLSNAIARVYIGDENARDFSSASTPFSADFVGMNGRALWSSVTVLDDDTVLAVAGLEDSVQPHPFGVYVSIGKVTRK